jgi:methionine-rich copper-binding protein CopC
MKHVSIITIVLMLMMIASLSAADRIAVTAAKVTADADRVTVPLELNNSLAMAALDLPLEFSEGVTLEEVTFEGTRSENFDFTVAKIDNGENTVIIGLIPMVYGESSDMAPGSGEIARLVFHVDDPDLVEFEIKTANTEAPDHAPLFVYTDENNGVNETKGMAPEFETILVALAEVPGSTAENLLPTEFSLRQNAPNPFNPTTDIAFDLPAPSKVKLEVLNVLGQHVTTLFDGYKEAGYHSVTWAGTDARGSAVASGIYFYRIQAGADYAVKKMMMLK